MINLIGYKKNITSTLLDKIHYTDTLRNTVEVILSKREISQSALIVSFINAHAMNLAQSNQMFYESLVESDLLFRDGIGMKILLKSVSMEPGANANGTDLIPELLSSIKGEKLALIGSKTEIINVCKTELEKIGHLVILHEHGFHTDEYYIQQLDFSNVEVVLLGMGMPRQELLAKKIKASLNRRLLIINGGAIIDFISGSLPRAPSILRKFGLEWLYRLFIEPKRLWRRYLLGNIRFLLGTIVYFFQQKK